jgi:hypothetical protein
MSDTPLYDAYRNFLANAGTPFTVPGHKRNPELIDDLLALDEIDQVRPLVGGDIGAEDQHDQLQALVAQRAADHRLDLARHVLDEIERKAGEVVGYLVDRQFGVQGHKGLKG